METTYSLQKQILSVINFMSPIDSTEKLFISNQNPIIYEIWINKFIEFCLKVARKEFMVSSLK